MWETSTVGSKPLTKDQLARVGDKAQTRPTQRELDRLARKFPSKKDRK